LLVENELEKATDRKERTVKRNKDVTNID